MTIGLPVPMPSSNRPPVSADSEFASWAIIRGGRSTLAITKLPTCSSLVASAATASEGATDGSCSPSGISSVEYPSSSARRAVLRQVSTSGLPVESARGAATAPNRKLLSTMVKR